MPLPKSKSFTAEDYWNLPEGVRAELIDGELYDMAPPNRVHQKIVLRISRVIDEYIERHNGECEVYPAPFAVNLNVDDTTYVEPDVSVICDPSKPNSRGCIGAPDFIAEVVSPLSRRMDYLIKGSLYSSAGVREYWESIQKRARRPSTTSRTRTLPPSSIHSPPPYQLVSIPG